MTTTRPTGALAALDRLARHWIVSGIVALLMLGASSSTLGCSSSGGGRDPAPEPTTGY
jgi:hypothetical protein